MSTGTTNSTDNSALTVKFILVLFCYFALHITLRVFISGSLDYDEAEQALLAQWLFAGYTEQPPLYSWMQYGLFQLFGRNVFAISLLKNSLLFFTYLFVYLSACEITKDKRAAILASISLLLIPQIGWESQRDMTHTTLVVFAAAATLFQVLCLVRKGTIINYILLGLLLGVGFLAKANFGLFLVVVLLTLFSLKKGRKTLFNRRVLITLLVMVAVSGSYFFWMYSNQDIVFSATYKFKRALDQYYLKGTMSLVNKTFLFLTPLWIIYLFVFPSGYGPYGPARALAENTDDNNNQSTLFSRAFIGRYLVVLFLVLLLVVLFFKVTYVKDRWLQPLLFAFPVFFIARLGPAVVTERRFRVFCKIVLVGAIGIYATFTIRVVGATYIDRFSRLNYPFEAMSEDIQKIGFSRGLIISDNRFLAGNMLFHFPDNTSIIPKYRFEKRAEISNYKAALVIWKADRHHDIPPNLAEFINNTYTIDVANYQPVYFEHPYKFARTETVKLGVLQFPLLDN